MSVIRRAALVATLVATSALVAPAGPAAAALPTAAVALGDSFISGEGAGNYQPVVDVNGVSQAFPGWSAPNSNAFFCHRSANASLLQASLPGIQDRYNMACSGGRPADFAAASSARDKGRTVAAQLDQLRAVAQTHDIDLVLVGLGSNNSSFTFGDVAEKCANRFIADAWTGWWEFWAYLNGPVEQAPCTADDLATAAQFSAATAETVAAVRQLLVTLNQVDADHQHRVVFQDYTNPLPFDLDSSYWEADGRQDDRDKFRDLGALRYAAGCPIHRASLSAGHLFSQGLGTLVQNVRNTVAAEFPNDDLVFLDVQHAFDGARLCEHAGSPANALATPIRLQDGPSGTFVTSLSGKDKIAIQRIANTCVSYFQTCQESWHPTAAGQAVLARCLAAAATTAARAVTCSRQPDGSLTTT
ncbi:SGNH/GDSL hydrolase family protein [Dactylosporangium darangshiense]|uniref:GDSL-like Lipase/Acylhydrolase family protein n=1 Tax=Dactylosporangium darangshiense TaxID=579108 RepID=A0ABP8DHG5_9ACTN